MFRILKVILLGLVALVLAGGLLYQFFGLRVVLDGGGMPHLRFVESAEAQAEEIARHRQATSQASAQAPELSAQPTAPAAIPQTPASLGSTPAPADPPSVATTNAPYW